MIYNYNNMTTINKTIKATSVNLSADGKKTIEEKYKSMSQ